MPGRLPVLPLFYLTLPWKPFTVSKWSFFNLIFVSGKKNEIAQRQIWLVQLVANEDCVFFPHKTLGHCGTVAQKFRFFLQYFLPQLTQDITVELCTVSVIPGAEIMAHNLVNVERRESIPLVPLLPSGLESVNSSTENCQKAGCHHPAMIPPRKVRSVWRRHWCFFSARSLRSKGKLQRCECKCKGSSREQIKINSLAESSLEVHEKMTLKRKFKSGIVSDLIKASSHKCLNAPRIYTDGESTTHLHIHRKEHGCDMEDWISCIGANIATTYYIKKTQHFS